jgi:hypothetical protein
MQCADGHGPSYDRSHWLAERRQILTDRIYFGDHTPSLSWNVHQVSACPFYF